MKVKQIIITAIAAIALAVAGLVGVPYYTVWSQEMDGKAEFAKAEQNRRFWFIARISTLSTHPFITCEMLQSTLRR